MKKLLLSLMLVTFALASCQREPASKPVNVDDEVSVTLSVDVPDFHSTRNGVTGMNSALGAIDNFDEATLWDKYDLRYIMEVYEVTDGFENYNSPIIPRMVQVLDRYDSTNSKKTKFTTRLVPNRTYRFVIWADFVANGEYNNNPLTVESLNYNTDDLKNITPKVWNAMDESRDAYFITETAYITTKLERDLTLTRPFGKLRVITTDIEELNIGSIPHKVEITYYNHPIYDSLNAITGDLNTTTKDLTYTFEVSKDAEDAPYTQGYDAKTTHQTLFVDYLYAKEDQTELNFRMDVSDKNGRPIKSLDFCTQIPLQRNHLTTIIGNLLTVESDVNIDINDNFDNDENDEDWIIRVWDGEYQALPAPAADGYIEIQTAGQLATLLSSDYRGMKARLMRDIDLGGFEIKHNVSVAVGGKNFVFDGQNHTIANFTSTEGQNGGLFGILHSAEVKNLVIKGATVKPGNSHTGDFYAGALAGTTLGYCTFENIKVADCEVEGVNKVGGLIGNAAENYQLNVADCSVDKSKVYTTHTEDGGCVGGFIGYIVPNTSIKGCAVKNTTIEAINSANAAKRANAEFVGTFHGAGKNIVIENCTLEGNTFTQAATSYVAPENFGAWLGGIRNEGTSDVTVDGESILIVSLAAIE